ncbi:micronuclear linker histone polyprotein [Rhopalosiphum padi]|uniref:micronuclear linker histone polyprotein n=1 Tax=Rhopalosiphum padi TaxID=40932 RepID=UPI00298E58D3|nr:micronuclear linker histone polyprotein [Rhopalosiphum padi]
MAPMARNKTSVPTDGNDREGDHYNTVDNPTDELVIDQPGNFVSGIVEMRRGRRSRRRRSRRRSRRAGRRRSSVTSGADEDEQDTEEDTSDNTSQEQDSYDDDSSTDADNEAADAMGRRRRGRRSRRRRGRRSSSRSRRRRSMSGRGRRRRVAGNNTVVDRQDLAGMSDGVEITDAARGRRRRSGSRRRRSSSRRMVRRQRRVLAEECGDSTADELNMSDATPSNNLLVSTTRDASRSRKPRRRTSSKSHKC